ncbi:MAG: 1-phosphofructokinase family hexose kinase [Catenulispora sp.]
MGSGALIVTVTLNPALDITYSVPELRTGATHRPRVSAQAGGKGVNVARTLHALGRETVAILPLGGFDGAAVCAELKASGVPHHAIPIGGATRRTVTVVETGSAGGSATAFNESGPEITGAEWAEIRAAVCSVLESAVSASVLVLSGKLPPGLPDDAYADLIMLADGFGVPAILDTEGPALLAGLAARPAIVKPNAQELFDATGLSDAAQAVAELLRRGARAVVRSNGPDGLTASISAESAFARPPRTVADDSTGVGDAATPAGTWTARPPRIPNGNPTGAGDAAVAALAVGLADGASWPDMLADAAALSAATVRTDRAGVFDAEAYRRFRAEITASFEN